MPKANLTTKEVARLLHISEATVKRWAETGALQSEKTLGGHRRFSIQSIARLRRDQNLGLEKQSRPTRAERMATTKPVIEPSEYLKLLLRGQEVEAGAMLIDAYLHHHSLPSIFDHIITGAMHDVGERWFRGDISVADEHLATQMVLSGLEKLRGVVVPEDQTGLSAICCGIEGDLHELPVHLAEIILESEGWDVINLGPNTPLFSLAEMVKQKQPDLICIAARTVNDLARATIEYEQLKKAAAKVGAAMILGGEAFVSSDMRARFPADLHANDFKTFSKFLQTISKKHR